MNMSAKNLVAALALVAGLSMSATAKADTIAWTQWSPVTTASTAGTAGTATGIISLGTGVTVTYSGQLLGVQVNYPSWGPSTSFAGGTVSNAPPASNNAVQMTGGELYTETITFSQAVHNPTFSIWSLGNSGGGGTFQFAAGQLFSKQAGGPSNEYNGGSIVVNGQVVSGNEGNGTLQFIGNYKTLTFTTPNYENYYDFTVGAPSLAPSATPEPSSLALLGTGLAGLGGMMKRRFKRA